MNSKLAQKIVDNLKEVIQHEVNFFDLKSQIVASTDLSRIGSFHSGALEVMNTGEDVIVYEENDELGVKPGYNTAVYHKKRIIGVVGITGQPQLVFGHTKIIRKVTELIVSESHLLEIAYSQRQHQQSLIEYIISKNHLLTPTSEILGGHNFYHCRRVVYAEFKYIENQDLDVYSVIKRFFNASSDLLAVTDAKIIILTIEVERDSLEQKLLTLTEYFENTQRLTVKFGVSTMISNLERVKNHHLEASYAWKWLIPQTSVNLIFYEDLTIERFLIHLTKEEMSNYVEQIMGGLSKDEVESFAKLFWVFEKNNGAIQASADELFIHKNTLQYRLNKFSETTGYNPRNYSDYVEIKLSLMSYFILK
ncbi:CdaR family transcriptional regulator [Fundicoccus sp. Sow4_D5]|uniref:CdaR family transcriptional regulator n=1 Tax=Fundicoccus sp. Sow4_D5 TaxID=3438782 RepID=UPI003F8F5DBE